LNLFVMDELAMRNIISSSMLFLYKYHYSILCIFLMLSKLFVNPHIYLIQLFDLLQSSTHGYTKKFVYLIHTKYFYSLTMMYE